MNRESERAANRARFPEFAELVDATGGRLLWASDDMGEIGKRPKPEPGTFEVSAETLVALAQQEKVRRNRK